MLVDAPANMGDVLEAGIKEITDEPIKYLILSHHHSDHAGSASILPEGIEVIASELAAKALQRASERSFGPYGIYVGMDTQYGSTVLCGWDSHGFARLASYSTLVGMGKNRCRCGTVNCCCTRGIYRL